MRLKSILLVEDSLHIQTLVEKALEKDYVVYSASTITEALEEVEKEEYALILLDVDLPDGDGFEFCARLKSLSRSSEIPIVFLTGRTAVKDRVEGLKLGAEDYVLKPFDSSELRARVEVQLRRSSQNRSETLSYGAFKVSFTKQEITFIDRGYERPLKLSSTEFKLLALLLKNEGRTLSRELILKEVWGEGVKVVGRVVDTQICGLRKKLGDSGECIRSIPKLGYGMFQSEMKKTS